MFVFAHIDISILFAEQLPINVIVENKICLNTQEIVEDIIKCDGKESAPTQEKPISGNIHLQRIK